MRIFRHIHRQSLRELFFAPAALINGARMVSATPFGVELSYLIMLPQSEVL